MTERFHLGDLLSITTGCLVSPDHIGGVYRVVDGVTGQQHMTHQLPRAAQVVRPWLLGQHPWLADIPTPEGLRGEDDVKAWLVPLVAEYGEFHDVEPMPLGMYVGREPIAEAEEMVGKDRVITLEIDGR